MNDVNATTIEGMLAAYDAGSTSGGAGTGQVSVNQPGDHGSNPGVYIRGRTTTPQLDGLQLNNGNYGDTSFGSTTTFNLERVEVIDGPQALLYDGVGPGGVLNEVEKQAHFGAPTSGTANYRIDQYGTKYATLDYGTSAGNLAARFSFIDSSIQSARVNIDDRLKGGYGQIAAQVFNTTIRLSLRQTVDTRSYQNYASLTSAGDPTFSKFTGDDLRYLLATGQAGGILGGNLNWGNVASLAGHAYTDYDVSESAVIKAETVWTSWLSTLVQAGLANYDDLQAGSGATLNFYSPQATANPIPGHWTMSFPSSGFPMEGAWRPHVGKAARFVAVATNTLFGGSAKSQTSFDVDSASETASLPTYRYYQADGNGNPLITSTGTDVGRTSLPTLSWTVDNGPVQYNFFNTGTNRIVYNGVPYVYNIQKSDGTESRNYYFQKGFALINYTQWLDGKLDTMIGARNNEQNGISNGTAASAYDKPEFMVGANYFVLPWLAPYVQFADLWNTDNNQQPDGTYAPNNHDVSEELGLKLAPADQKVSGSVSFWHRADSSENFTAPGISADVSPNGLNGQIASGVGSSLDTDATTWGATAAITAQPATGWRMRLSASWNDGKFNQRAAYNQIYNDQFYDNSQGQVTYADGSVVYVPAAFNSKQYTVPQGTAGATPLTVSALSTPSNPYYAQPQPVTGAILKTSNGGLVLLNGAGATAGTTGHGSILTGATDLPISAYQLLPSLSNVSPAGVIYGAPTGGRTFGYPEFAFNLTSVYELPYGPLKGLELGGTVSANWRYIISYYYNGLGAATSESALQQFSYPTRWQFDAILGYTRKFGRFTYHTQLNVFNLFNHYDVLIYPNVSSGFGTVTSLSANFDAQPRMYAWSNSLKF